MNRYTLENHNQDRPYKPDKGEKQEALAYLKKALVNEEYERCAYLVADAKDKGAGPDEIRALLAASVEHLGNAASKPPQGRLRF